MTDPHEPEPPRPFAFLGDILTALRPNQWTKNGVVLAAFFFAFFDRSRAHPLPLADLMRVIPAVFLFCLISSGIYLLNDIFDRDADRQHPVKKFRPIAAGRISVPQAWMLSLLLLGAGLGGSFLLSVRFAWIGVGYAAMHVLYSVWLKQIPIVDTLMIAAGFVLRAVAGARVLPDVAISGWLLACTFLLALFLALCKRRHEKALIRDTASAQRPSLKNYSERLLNILIGITGIATVGAYAAYTLWPGTIEKFGTGNLGYTLPFVAFGIVRYLSLVYRHGKGEQPERILLTDIPLLVNLVLYGLSVILILRHGW